MTPQRIQLRRTPGWRMPPNTRSVARPSRWGNPFQVVKWAGRYGGWQAVGNTESGPVREAKKYAVVDAVELFRLHAGPMGSVEIDQADLDALTGLNLACYCPVGTPCHADTLIAWCNP